MPAVIPFIPLIASVAGPLLGKALGGGGDSGGSKGGGGVTNAAPKKLFNPEQIKSAQDQYATQGNAKWNQILANMGGGDPNATAGVSSAISDQAKQMGTSLGGLTTESGYGSDGMANLGGILSALEGGVNPKYKVY